MDRLDGGSRGGALYFRDGDALDRGRSTSRLDASRLIASLDCSCGIVKRRTMLGRLSRIFRCSLPKCSNFNFPGMEKAESSTGDESNAELEDRDPNNLNRHLQVMWDDVIGEPEGIRSPECAWRLSGHCFRLSRSCCYVFLSVLVAPLLALCFGFMFACLAFQHIWCLAPCLRVWKITCAATRNFFSAVMQAIVRPVMDSLGYLFHNIRVFNQKLPDGPAEKDDLLVV